MAASPLRTYQPVQIGGGAARVYIDGSRLLGVMLLTGAADTRRQIAAACLARITAGPINDGCMARPPGER
jgi:hypothetical protein